MPKESAGLLMYRSRKSTVEILLVHPGGPFWKNKDEGAWTIPKGELDEGETPLAAAQREFHEELGFPATGPFHPLGSIKQKAGNRTDRGLHYHFARHLMSHNGKKSDAIAYHLQRSFSPGDVNYDAQLLYGRQLYINGDRDGAKQIFASLKEAKIAPEFKNKMLYPLDGEFKGAVVRIEGNYGFLSKDGTADWVHFHRNNVQDAVWMKLTIGTRCNYKIAFNFHGAGALETSLAMASQV